MATMINNTSDSSHWQGCELRETLNHCWWEHKCIDPLWKLALDFLRKIRINLTLDLGIHYWAYTQRVLQSTTRDSCSVMIITALSIISRDWKQVRWRCGMEDQTGKSRGKGIREEIWGETAKI